MVPCANTGSENVQAIRVSASTPALPGSKPIGPPRYGLLNLKWESRHMNIEETVGPIGISGRIVRIILPCRIHIALVERQANVIPDTASCVRCTRVELEISRCGRTCVSTHRTEKINSIVIGDRS